MTEVEMVKSKKTAPVQREVPTGVRLTDELRHDVETICELEGIPLATFIRNAVHAQVQNNPQRQRRLLLRSVAITTAQFERALELGVLQGTEAEAQADEIRRFFGQLAAVLHGEHEEEAKEG